MKIRADFVTNSSSSSFICVRVDSDIAEEVLKANELDEDRIYEMWQDDECYENLSLKGGLTCTLQDGEVYYVGIDIANDLYDKTVRQHEDRLIDILDKEYGIKATEDDVSFDYGEIENG